MAFVANVIRTDVSQSFQLSTSPLSAVGLPSLCYRTAYLKQIPRSEPSTLAFILVHTVADKLAESPVPRAIL